MGIVPASINGLDSTQFKIETRSRVPTYTGLNSYRIAITWCVVKKLEIESQRTGERWRDDTIHKGTTKLSFRHTWERAVGEEREERRA